MLIDLTRSRWQIHNLVEKTEQKETPTKLLSFIFIIFSKKKLTQDIKKKEKENKIEKNASSFLSSSPPLLACFEEKIKFLRSSF